MQIVQFHRKNFIWKQVISITGYGRMGNDEIFLHSIRFFQTEKYRRKLGWQFRTPYPVYWSVHRRERWWAAISRKIKFLIDIEYDESLLLMF